MAIFAYVCWFANNTFYLICGSIYTLLSHYNLKYNYSHQTETRKKLSLRLLLHLLHKILPLWNLFIWSKI
jgi:hypothetical protein